MIIALVLVGYTSFAQQLTTKKNLKINKSTVMKTYVIEREIPNAGKLTAEELKAIAQKSNSVLKEMGPQIEWQQSYVTGNKIYCVYKAPNEELIKEHARKGGFPANSVSEVANMINPATASH
ncbi:hypothetical protein SAE01_11860 [Segetibacter aerophilus]|uniref:DUF4242 domain-containing protein n=2 Tax=Segetibacter aerophilus TaxID=670293 RepID=A0A512B9Q4_9BACT|nr:hypothetical protein SAE01_11860 [Segetibacter aerophilus]